jgi:hypothetical protein
MGSDLLLFYRLSMNPHFEGQKDLLSDTKHYRRKIAHQRAMFNKLIKEAAT